MWQTARLTILYIFLLVMTCGVYLQHANAILPNVIYGASSDATPPSSFITPCSTLSYNIDATLTFPIFGDTPIMNQHVVDLSQRADRVGYFITRNNTNSTEVWVYSYNATSMIALNSVQLQAFGQLDYSNRLARVHNNNLYIVRQINGGRLGCGIGRNCASITKVQPSGTVSPGLTVDLVTASFSTLDDLMILPDGTAILAFGDGVGRRLATFNAPSQSFIGFGPQLAGFVGQPSFAYYETGATAVYVGEQGGLDIASFSPGNTTPSDTDVFSYVFSNTNAAYTTALDLGLLLGGSSSVGGFAANIAYKDLALTNVNSTQSYLNSTDGSASKGGLYYDSVNGVLHSLRTDAGAGNPNIIRSTIYPLTILQRYSACGIACTSNTYRTFDFVKPSLRFYFGSQNGFINAIITRVKACSTGGPPA